MPYKYNAITGKLDLVEDISGSGDVNGPASSTDGDIALFDGTTGKLLQDGGVGLPQNDGELIIGDTAGDAQISTITGGTGITVTNGAGSITIDADNNGDVTASANLTDDAVVVGDGGSNGVKTLASLGTSGQILTSNGAGTPPSFQNAAGGGITVQQVYNATTTHGTTTADIPFDDTIPQQSEGAEVITVSITPNDASNILVIEACGPFATNSGQALTVALFQDSTANSLTATSMIGETDHLYSTYVQYRMTAGTTSATTFKLRYGRDGAFTASFNGLDTGRIFGGVAITWIKVTEQTP